MKHSTENGPELRIGELKKEMGELKEEKEGEYINDVRGRDYFG